MQQINSLKQAISEYIINSFTPPQNGELDITSINIDERINIPDCPVNFELFANNNVAKRNVNILVSCPVTSWKIYIPVKLTFKAPMLIATRNLVKGEIISAQDIAISMLSTYKFRKEGFSNSKFVVGSKLKKNVSYNDVIERDDICVVCRNESVTIKAVKGQMELITQGTAMQDGSIGEQIRVKNDKSERIISGIVTDVAQITINF